MKLPWSRQPPPPIPADTGTSDTSTAKSYTSISIKKPKRATFFGIFGTGDYRLQNEELIFSAVSRIANALASMPIQLYDGQNQKVSNHLNELIHCRPNRMMTSANFFRTMESCRLTSGNCYALKVPKPNGTVDRFDLLDPARVSPVIDTESQELYYQIRTDAQTLFVHSYHMIHVPGLSTNGILGINPIHVLTNSLSYNGSVQRLNLKMVDKGIDSPIVLTAPSSLGESKRKETINAFVETYQETSGNILLLESGITASTLKISPVDMNLLEVEKITRSKVAMVYNLPPHLLGDYSDTSFASQEQQAIEFLTLTMLPTVIAYQQEFDCKTLLPEQRRRGFKWRFDMEAILMADTATRSDMDFKALRSAAKTPDEIRAKRDLPPLPNNIGKEALVSKDLIPLSMLKEITRKEAINSNEPKTNTESDENAL